MRANARAWRAHGGVQLRAVIKSNGYGWGFETLVRALDSEVEGYYVGNADEFHVVRALTQRPIAILLDAAPARVGAILAAGGIPTVSSLAALDAVHVWATTSGKRARVRVAVRDAIGWSGVAPPDFGRFAALLAERRLDVEASSHITDASLQVEQTKTFEDAITVLRNACVSVVATDLASSAPLARGSGVDCSYARLGVGLFGARFGADVAVECAIEVRADVAERHPARGQYVGYGVARAPGEGYLATVRCGYGDGFPRALGGPPGILAVGMQFTTVHRSQPVVADTLALIEPTTDLDLLAASAGISVHQVVTSLGLGRTAHDAHATEVPR